MGRIVKPRQWNVRPDKVDPKWAWFWDELVLGCGCWDTRLTNFVDAGVPTIITAPVMVRSQFGTALDTQNASSSYRYAIPSPAGAPVTYAALFEHNITGEYGRIINAENGFVQIRSNEVLQWADGVSNFTTTISVPANRPVLVFAQSGGGQKQSVAMYDFLTRELFFEENANTSGPLARTNIEVADSDGGAVIDANYIAFYAWNRRLPVSELYKLSADPFGPIWPDLGQRAFGTVAGPGEVTGTAAAVLPTISVAASGTAVAPTFTGTAAAVLPTISVSAAGTVAVPAFTGTAAAVLPAITVSAAGTTVAPTFEGTAAAVLPTISVSATGTVAGPGEVTGTAAAVLPTISVSASGTTVAPTFTGTAAAVLPKVSVSATGTVSGPGEVTGTGAMVLPTISVSATGTVVGPGEITATGALTLPSVAVSAAGTVAVPAFTGTAALTLPSVSVSAAGTTVAPVFTGTAALTLPAVTITATGLSTEYTPPTLSMPLEVDWELASREVDWELTSRGVDWDLTSREVEWN